MSKPTFYITTPIYYPSDRLHVGHAYTTTAADAIARYKKLAGFDVYFLTGSDEHGVKIQRAAEAKGVSPERYVDEIVATFKDLWQRLGIEYDDFIRTTEPRHIKAVQEIFRRLQEKGDIYKSHYEGWYCSPCEAFWLERQLVQGNCPDCGRPVEKVKEESYFFRLSKYQDRLLEHIEKHPEFIQPEARRHEMVAFIKSGLEDLSVSRTTFTWGIPVLGDEKHVIYVWIDALSNYITALGWGTPGDEKFRRYWPADVHLMGKEIVRFHSIIWPAILMALDLPLPKRVFGHGWLLFGEDKMSKSKGNVVDPIALIDEFGADALRYFLLREISFGQDGNFSRLALMQKINSDLANDLGNLLHRTAAMLDRYYEGRVPEWPEVGPLADAPFAAAGLDDGELAALAPDVVAEYREHMDALELNQAMAAIWKLIGRANKYIDEKAPWLLKKNGEEGRLARVMYSLVESLRIVAILIYPAMPRTAEEVWSRLGQEGRVRDQSLADCAFGRLKPGTRVAVGEPLFPRLEIEETADGGGDEEVKPAKPAVAPREAAREEQVAVPEAPKDSATEERVDEEQISIEEFSRIQLRVATVVAAEKHPNADKLLKLSVDLGGGERRQIVAGIARHYAPADLVGKQIVVVANLRPAKLRGEVSQGMLLAASTEDGAQVIVVSPEKPIAPGSRVK